MAKAGIGRYRQAWAGRMRLRQDGLRAVRRIANGTSLPCVAARRQKPHIKEKRLLILTLL